VGPRPGRRPSLLWALGAILVPVALALPASVAMAAPGDLTGSFSGDGKQLVNFGGDDRATHVAVTPDGRIVVIGSTTATGSGDFAVARLRADGTPDGTFDLDGRRTIGTQAGVNDTGGGVAVLPDERIVISGQGNSTQDFVTKRLTASGGLDPTFTGGGTSVVDFGGNDAVNNMVRQPDGKLVLVGSTSGGGGDFAIARLNSNGTPDTSFSGDGKQTVTFGGNDAAQGVAIAPGGKIVVTGQGGASSDVAVARLNANGTLDASFAPATPGKALVNFGGNDGGSAVAVQPDGKVVVNGVTSASGSGDFAVTRLTAGGAPDPTFNGDGKLTLGYGAAGELGLAVAVQQNGRIVLQGNGGAGANLVLTRLTPGGGIDSSFGAGGTRQVDFGATEFDGDVTLQPDGNIVTVGSTNVNAGAFDMVVARLQGDPTVIPPPPPRATFSNYQGGDGKPKPKPGLTILNASGTTGATTLRWDINGDGKPDVECPGSQPYLVLHLNSTSRVTAKLIAEGPGGTSTSRAAFTPNSTTATTLGTAETATCAPSIEPFLAALEPPKVCSQQTVIFGLTDVRGCMTREDDVRDIPSKERAVVRRHYESERVSPVVTAICNQAKAGKLPQSKCDRAKEIFKERLFDAYVSKKSVRMNGITIAPRSGAAVVVYPSLQRVISSKAVMSWGGMRVKPIAGAIDMNLASNVKTTGKSKKKGPSLPPQGSAKIFSFDGKRDLPAIDGFRLDGQVDLVLKASGGRRSSVGTLRLTLPPTFTLFGGRPPSAEAGLAASNSGGGPVLDHIRLSVPQADFKSIKITDLSFEYRRDGRIDNDYNPGTTCARKEWKARGNVFILGEKGQAGFKLTPPPPQNGIGFCAGNFKHFGGALKFGGPIPKPQLFPGVLLDELNFAIQLNPVLIRGGGQISVIDLSVIRGALLAAFATPREPYKLTARDGPEFRQLGDRLFTSTTFAVGGNLFLQIPGFGTLPFADGALMYSYPDFIAFNGNARFVLPGMGLYGGVEGQATVRQKLFTAGGHLKACLGGVKKGACLGGDAWVTSRGAVACLNLLDTLHPGAGYYWGGKLTVWPFDGCKPSRYWVKFASARTSQAGGATFKVAKGEGTKNVRLVGRGGAPSVRVTAPGGQHVDVSGDQFQVAPDKRILGIRQVESGTTYVGAKGAGTYRVDLLPGSAPIAGVAGSRAGYDTDFSARVRGKGARRTLVYDARRKGGQSVTFFEKGRNVFHRIGRSTGGRGKFRFTPAPGRGGVRRIVTVATLDHTAIPDQVLTKFKVAGTPRTGKPRRVRVRRRGKTLSVSWRKARGATRYGVVVRYSNGHKRGFELSAKRRKLRIRNVPLTQGGSVSVSARGFFRDWAKPRVARFRRLKTPPTVLQTNKVNQKRTAAKKRRAAARRRAKARRRRH
jgi:uncharacterized delta-60 repeat protein